MEIEKQISEMEAGPEINALIEVEIFGAALLTDEEFDLFKAAYALARGQHEAQAIARPLKIPRDEREWYTKLLFHLAWPSNYSADAFHSSRNVVEKMRADGWLFDIADFSTPQNTVIKIAGFQRFTEEGELRAEGSANTDALAICRAALTAVREWKRAMENTR